MNTLIVGRGEIGNSLYNILKRVYAVWCEDIKPELRIMDGIPKEIQIIHVCVRYTDQFKATIETYQKLYPDAKFNVCTTVPVGTVEKFGPNFVHSTTRGLHPHLELGLQTITKHIGGPYSMGFKNYFEAAGIPCHIHALSRTTELLHILNNCHYGANILFAEEASRLCREYGVDFYDYLKYTETNNDGYMAMGMKTKVRTIATPPQGKIGGHCLTMSANLIPKELRGTLIGKLAES